MARGAYNFCPCDSMPAPAVESRKSALPPPIDTPTEPANEVMTWQQQKDFGYAAVSEGEDTMTPDQPRTPACGRSQQA